MTKPNDLATKLMITIWVVAFILLGLLWLTDAPGFIYGLFIGIPVGVTAMWFGQAQARRKA